MPVDFPECGPCGGKCCRNPWTVFASPRDLDRLAAATGKLREDFATVAPLPRWEKEAFGEGNLLFSRVTAEDGSVPQLKKRGDGSCVFLESDGRCGVHPSKPLLCRLFPFYYATAPTFPSGERPSPQATSRRLTDGKSLFLLVDRGHVGFCPITEERMGEEEARGADDLVHLAAAFEADVERYASEKEDFVARWREGI